MNAMMLQWPAAGPVRLERPMRHAMAYCPSHGQTVAHTGLYLEWAARREGMYWRIVEPLFAACCNRRVGEYA